MITPAVEVDAVLTSAPALIRRMVGEALVIELLTPSPPPPACDEQLVAASWGRRYQ
ncbi:unnamed protein product [Ectocarpus sp. 13 AM-2016]